MTKTMPKLLDEVEALCRVYIGKDAESEQWLETLNRLDRIDRLLKRVRKEQVKLTSR